MLGKWWALIGIVTLSSSTTVYAGCADDIYAKIAPDQIAQNAFIALADCIVEQKTEIDRLKANTVPAIGEHPKTAAIVAFVSDKGEKACPKGWAPYEAAKDRFIVGAGGLFPTVAITGGESEVTLTKLHLPKHNHNISTSYETDPHNGLAGSLEGNGIDWDFDDPTGKTIGAYGVMEKVISNTGMGKPHNNIPPYIALFYCKKEN